MSTTPTPNGLNGGDDSHQRRRKTGIRPCMCECEPLKRWVQPRKRVSNPKLCTARKSTGALQFTAFQYRPNYLYYPLLLSSQYNSVQRTTDTHNQKDKKMKDNKDAISATQSQSRSVTATRPEIIETSTPATSTQQEVTSTVTEEPCQSPTSTLPESKLKKAPRVRSAAQYNLRGNCSKTADFYKV